MTFKIIQYVRIERMRRPVFQCHGITYIPKSTSLSSYSRIPIILHNRKEVARLLFCDWEGNGWEGKESLDGNTQLLPEVSRSARMYPILFPLRMQSISFRNAIVKWLNVNSNIIKRVTYVYIIEETDARQMSHRYISS